MRILLFVARALYALVGIGAVLLAVGTVAGGLSPGAHVDWIGFALGVVVGLGALAAAAWVTSPSPARALLASIGIAIMLFAALLPAYGLFGTEHGSDVIVFYVVPIVLDLLLSAVMARAMWSVRAMTSLTP